MFRYRHLNIKKHTKIIFGREKHLPRRILKIRNESCAHENLKFEILKSLTKNEFTHTYTSATYRLDRYHFGECDEDQPHEAQFEIDFFGKVQIPSRYIFLFFSDT